MLLERSFKQAPLQVLIPCVYDHKEIQSRFKDIFFLGMAVKVDADRLFFAISQSQTEDVHDQFDIRICVDDLIDNLEFFNMRTSTDRRVNANSALPSTDGH